MADTLTINVRDMTVPIGNNINIAVINQPNPVTGYTATKEQILDLLNFPKYMIKETATGTVIDGTNYYDYFPEPGSVSGDVYTKEEVNALMTTKQDVLQYDSYPTEDSEKSVKSGGIYSYVNSSVATNTANFIGTFASVDELEAYTGDVTNNDYAFVVSVDADGNTVYKRYKYNAENETWNFEYDLNNSSYTAAEWATIQSGLTAQDKTNLDDHLTNYSNPHAVTAAQLGLGDVNTILTPISEDAYEQLPEKDKSLYFVYEN